MILRAAGVNRGDRCAVAVAEQEPALKADGVEHMRQHARLVVHEAHGARQQAGARAAIAGARIDKHADACRGGELRWKIAPQPDAAEPFVQHHDGRRFVRPRADHAVFEPRRADVEEACVGKPHGYSLVSSHGATMRKSFEKLCSTVSSEVSSCAPARA